MHVSRGRNTPNANRSKLADNQTLIHNNDAHLPLSEVVHNKIYSIAQRRKVRIDAVFAVEILLSASPEYFRPTDPSRYGEYDADKLEKWKRATVHWLKEEYGERIVRAVLHCDEGTPHIHAHLVPLDLDGQLNCKKIFGDRAKLSAFQDSYAAATKHLGLERGVRDTQAEHTTIKDYYSVVNSVSTKELDPHDWRTFASKSVAYAALQKEHQELQRRLKVVAQQRDELADKLALTEQSVTVQTQINRALIVPKPLISLPQVEAELNLPPGQFEGIDPIDLVMNTYKIDLTKATQWLTKRFGAAAAIGLANDRVLEIVSKTQKNRFSPPESVRANWDDVRSQLTTKQQLPAKLIDRLHDDGLIYANADGKLICLHRDLEGQFTGATSIDLKSERLESKLLDGSSRTGGHFYFSDRSQADAARIVITAGPIEAIAYSVIHEPDCPTQYLAAHDGRWIPTELLNMEVAIATDLELLNLPSHASVKHLPMGKSWATDLKALVQSILTINTLNEQVEKQRQLDSESAEQKAPRSTPRSMPLEHKRGDLSA